MKKSGKKAKSTNVLIVFLCVCLIILLASLGMLVWVISMQNSDAGTDPTSESLKPELFTWEQYQALTPEQKLVFPDYFESMEAYNAWYASVQPTEEVRVPPVELGDKKPEDFTWEEYEALSQEQKMIFPDYFESMEAYNAWYASVQPTEETNAPTVDFGGKKPEDFTWEEYEALTPEQKLVFPDYFESTEAYNQWYASVQPTEETIAPTVEFFGKKPEDFTWEEYEALTPEQKLVFPDSFESMDAYNAWYERVNPEVTEPSAPGIDISEKKPEEYTWEDYQALTPEQKMVFPDYFESFEAYQEWYDRVCPEE